MKNLRICRDLSGFARYLPDFDYSGRLEILVWSIPLMTILLVGGVAWLSSYDLDPPKAMFRRLPF